MINILFSGSFWRIFSNFAFSLGSLSLNYSYVSSILAFNPSIGSSNSLIFCCFYEVRHLKYQDKSKTSSFENSKAGYSYFKRLQSDPTDQIFANLLDNKGSTITGIVFPASYNIF
jgi:hypothetical protein